MKANEVLINLLKDSGPLEVRSTGIYVVAPFAFGSEEDCVKLEITDLASLWEAWNADVYHFGYIRWMAKKLGRKPNDLIVDTAAKYGVKLVD